MSQTKDSQPAGAPPSMDALLPAEMAAKAERVGVAKAGLASLPMFSLAVLAGAFIALGAVFSTTVTSGAAGLPYGVTRLLAGLAFSLGLILVVVGGAELFTGNNLIVMAWAARRVTTGQLLRNWGLVYLGNLAGSLATAGLMFLSGQYGLAQGGVGLNALNIAQAKCALEPLPAVALGLMCNALVCLAVWLCYSARGVMDKIACIVFPITAFVACGFEHSVANMYFIPIGLFIKQWAPDQFWGLVGRTALDFPDLTWRGMVWANLLPVTLGNVVGGSVMVGLAYWSIYLRGQRG